MATGTSRLMRFLGSVALSLIIAASGIARAPGAAFAEPFVQGSAARTPDAPGSLVEILPQMELLAAVQSQTSFIDTFGPTGEGNEYFRAVKAFMEPYQGHQAVQALERLRKTGFSYSYPVEFALSLGPLPELEPVAKYSGNLIGREKTLEELRLALKALAQESRFMEFFNSWQDKYDQWISSVSAGLDFAKVTNWMSDFFGSECPEFHVVLAPAMFRAGYGATIYGIDGTTTVYETICGSSSAISDPVFPSAGANLEKLSLHEIGHSFVNPAMEGFRDRITALEPLFGKVESLMTSNAYTDVYIFMNEQVLRGMVALATRDLYGEAAFGAEVKANEDEGFYFTKFTAEEMADFAANRAKYPKFIDFVPVLLDRMKEGPLQDVLRAQTLATRLGAAAAVVATGTIILLMYRRRAARKSMPRPEPPSP